MDQPPSPSVPPKESRAPSKGPLAFFKTEVQEFRGPLPHPGILAGYEEIVPGAGERILAMAENQEKHRHEIENRLVEHRIKTEGRGQIFGFVLGLSAMAGGFVLVAMDKNVEGLAVFFSALATLIGIALYGRKQKTQDKR